MGDLHTIRTFDGKELHIPDEANRFLVYIGYGAPPIEYITQRGYKQHGETKLGYVLSSRNITVQFWKSPACTRAEYWANRLALHDILRPNRGGSIELILTIPDGTQRAILLDPQPGAEFNTSQLDDNNWEIDETLDFIAFNPIWYNPTLTVQAVSQDATQELVFPIVFPIMFGPGGVVYTATIQYNGSWQSYPTLIIQGPYTSVLITNEVTGAVIELTIPIVAGEFRILDLTPGAISIVDGNGDSVFGDLGDDSNLVDFTIEPDPIAPSGVNTITAQIFDGTPATRFTIDYQERFYAI
jgi:hypothetical protein